MPTDPSYPALIGSLPPLHLTRKRRDGGLFWPAAPIGKWLASALTDAGWTTSTRPRRFHDPSGAPVADVAVLDACDTILATLRDIATDNNPDAAATILAKMTEPERETARLAGNHSRRLDRDPDPPGILRNEAEWWHGHADYDYEVAKHTAFGQLFVADPAVAAALVNTADLVATSTGIRTALIRDLRQRLPTYNAADPIAALADTYAAAAFVSRADVFDAYTATGGSLSRAALYSALHTAGWRSRKRNNTRGFLTPA